MFNKILSNLIYFVCNVNNSETAALRYRTAYNWLQSNQFYCNCKKSLPPSDCGLLAGSGWTGCTMTLEL